MKKTKKRILGLFGLAIVVAMTIVAALLPTAETSATSSVVDTVTVRVMSYAPSAEIKDPTSGEAFVSPDQTIRIDYDSVKDLVVTIEYTAPDGTKQSKTLWSGEVSEQTGELLFDFREISEEFGFGDYIITLTGTGMDNVPLPGDSVAFTYNPLSGSVDSNLETGEVFLDLTYAPYEEGGPGVVDTLKINVYDKDGNLITQFSPLIVNAPDTKVELPFLEYGLAQGLYRLEVTAFGVDGNQLYPPYYLNAEFRYASSGDDTSPEGGDVSPETPDTGGLIKSLNISQADFLITGFIIFALIAICAFFFIVKRCKISDTEE